MGGDIVVESTLGEGAVFTLRLPRVMHPRQAESLVDPDRVARASNSSNY
jgi:hypothetical protein